MAGGKGKDTFTAESISLLCFLRCCDLWQPYSPGKRVGRIWIPPGASPAWAKEAGERHLFLWAMGCGAQELLCTQNNDGVLVWDVCMSGLREGLQMLLWGGGQRLSLQ